MPKPVAGVPNAAENLPNPANQHPFALR
jgi:hypothetical protein